jgi:hypothetical protein
MQKRRGGPIQCRAITAGDGGGAHSNRPRWIPVFLHDRSSFQPVHMTDSTMDLDYDEGRPHLALCGCEDQ